MRTRLAIVAMLVFGFALSGSGAGLAISGSSAPGATSAQSQYNSTDDSQVLGDVESGGGSSDDESTSSEDDSGVAGTGTGSGDVAAGSEEGVANTTARQVTAESGDTLPFTGAAAIPVMVLGLALLGGGLFLRHRTRSV